MSRPKNVRERVVLLKSRLDINSKEMAKLVGIPYGDYRAFERNKRRVRPLHLRKIDEFAYSTPDMEDMIFENEGEKLRVWMITNDLSISKISRDLDLDYSHHDVKNFVMGYSDMPLDFIEAMEDLGYESLTS